MGDRNRGSLGDGGSKGVDFEWFQVGEFCDRRAEEDCAEVVQMRTGRPPGAIAIFQRRVTVLE